MSNGNEIVVVNSTSLITNLTNNDLLARADSFKQFKEFVKNDFVDGVDYGVIPSVKKPCLFKAGGEKAQMLLGLTPEYKLLNREFIANNVIKNKVWNSSSRTYDTVEQIRNYYSWEWSCELWYNDKKVGEGVGSCNSEERKYVSQYEKGETPDSLANTIMKISKKRAFMDAILGVSGLSDMFTQDLEEDETIQKLKVDKTSKVNKLTKDQIKLIYATVGATGLVDTDLKQILNEMGYTSIKDCKPEDCNKILEQLKNLAKERKGEN